MKITLLIAILNITALLASPAGAELCQNCNGKAYTEDTKPCPQCKQGYTASGQFLLCPKCSKTLGKCERCRGDLAGSKLDGSVLPLLDVTAADTGRIIPAVVGQKILIRLGGDRWKGPNWLVETVKGTSVEQTGKKRQTYAGPGKNVMAHEIEVIANTDTVEDTGAKMTFFANFQAVKPGKTVVTMVAKRNLAVKKADHTLTFTIDVKTPQQIAELTKTRLAKLNKAAEKNTVSVYVSCKGSAARDIPSLAMYAVKKAPTVNAMQQDITVSKIQILAVLDLLGKTQWLGRACEGEGNFKAPGAQPAVVITVAGPDGMKLSSSAGWEPHWDMVQQLRAIDSALMGKPAQAMLKMITRLGTIEKPAAQGVWGTVKRLTGNHMPSMGPGFVGPGGGGRGGTELLSVTVHIFKGSVPVFSKPNRKHKAFLKTVQSDKKGRYVAGLKPGIYTIVAEIDGKLYLNSFSGGRPHSWSTVEVKAGKWTTRWDITDSSGAAF